jgi:hypothetical protein
MTGMIQTKNTRQQGMHVAVVMSIVLGVLAIGLTALSGWLFIQYNEKKTNVDGKVAAAVAEAKREQSQIDQENFLEKEKEPNRQFVGPDDYGRLTFSYPKTWSVYVASDASKGGEFKAYLNPREVPPVAGAQQRFALRVAIEDRDYDQVNDTYKSQIASGKLKSSIVTVDGVSGTRYDGSFSNDIRGAVVLFKVRDKTVLLFTDANTFKKDFDKIIKTVKFNQ